MSRQINDAGLELIKGFEGLRLLPYQDSAGVWTIGYGRTRGITAHTGRITKEQAETFLRDDLDIAEKEVSTLIKVPLTDNEFSALVSLVFNAGSEPLLMTLGKMLNDRAYVAAACQFPRWIYVKGQISKGLVRRRDAEKKLFLSRNITTE